MPTINKKARNQEPVLQDTASAARPQETSHLQPRLPQNDVPRKRTASSHDLSPSTKRQGSVSNLENYFKLMPTGSKAPEIEPTQIPDVATDVGSTYLRLRTKRDAQTEDKEFQIVKNTLSEFRGYISQRRLHHIITDPANTPKTIRQYFKVRNMGDPITLRIQHSGLCKTQLSHTWRIYYVKLFVLAQARRWLEATERLDPIEDSPPTPKTNFQLAEAIRRPESAEYAPFGHDFEDTGAYSPLITRLLLYAEIHNCDDHDHGTFASPRQLMPYTYRQLQEWVLERRRRLQRLSNAVDNPARQLVKTADDLSAKLCAFASDGIVVKHLIDFAFPSKKRANAYEITRTQENIGVMQQPDDQRQKH